ncbi:hypothetical protein SALWKB12_1549 [Snodgrassella communis]|uniref:Uncharacterized protein n=1 Tax=Snodgrassella communis TaxID=2946699 RepID=A0A837AGJ3_9NEIS|nr:hypothetical protein SALWKB12_1549 [Snodgrassella communis]KDN13958.1 hypothetical protein SALWKB29_2029 [Snodgrassella communis]
MSLDKYYGADKQLLLSRDHLFLYLNILLDDLLIFIQTEQKAHTV